MKKYEKESMAILTEIKKAKRILINAHRNPDLDSIGSSLTMSYALKRMGKEVAIICPHVVTSNFYFLKGADQIQTIDYDSFDFTKYDLFLILDSANWHIVTGKKELRGADIPIVVIDHHNINTLKGLVKLVDKKACAVAEMVYHLLTNWNIYIDKDTATALFSGMAGDTVFFKYSEDPISSFETALHLLRLRADKELLVNKYFNNYQREFVTLMGIFLERMTFDKKGKFTWAAVPYEIYKKLDKPAGARETVADSFFRSIQGSDFGVAMLEEEKNKLAVSFRSRGDVDVSLLAQLLGGGGHTGAAGVTLYLPFKQAVQAVLLQMKNRK